MVSFCYFISEIVSERRVDDLDRAATVHKQPVESDRVVDPGQPFSWRVAGLESPVYGQRNDRDDVRGYRAKTMVSLNADGSAADQPDGAVDDALYAAVGSTAARRH